MPSSSATQRGMLTSLAPVSTMKGARTLPLSTATTRMEVPARATGTTTRPPRALGDPPAGASRAGLEELWVRTSPPDESETMAAAAAELDKAGIETGSPKLGVMIEVPSAAVTARALARHADFFSIEGELIASVTQEGLLRPPLE